MENEQDSTGMSHIDTTSCPICSNTAITEYVYKTNEENIQCHSCGYARRLLIVDGIPQITELPAFGCYKVQMKNAPMLECGSFMTINAEQEFTTMIANLGDQVVSAEYSKLVDSEIKTTVLK